MNNPCLLVEGLARVIARATREEAYTLDTWGDAGWAFVRAEPRESRLADKLDEPQVRYHWPAVFPERIRTAEVIVAWAAVDLLVRESVDNQHRFQASPLQLCRGGLARLLHL